MVAPNRIEGLDYARALPAAPASVVPPVRTVAREHILAANATARVPRFFYFLLLLLIGGTLLLRLRVLSTPLERDEGEYAYAGQLLLQGIPPYQLAYNMKLPGTYFAYAAGMALFGETEQGIHLLLALANAATILLLFFLGQELFGAVAGLCAAAVFAVAAASPDVLGMAGHANHFVILFAVPAVWLLWRALRSNRRSELFSTGLLFGLSFLMKQQAIFFLLFGVLCLAARHAPRLVSCLSHGRAKLDVERLKLVSVPSGVAPCSQGSVIEPVMQLLLLCGGMLLPFIATCIYLKTTGVFPAFTFWVFQYAHHYLSVASLGDGLEYLRRHLAASSTSGLGFRLLAIVGFASALRVQSFRKEILFTACFALCSFAAVSVGFFFRPHYFILGLPALALLAGLGSVELGKGVASRIARRGSRLAIIARSVPITVTLLAVGTNLYAARQAFFSLTPVEIVQHNYPDNPFLESKIVAEYIRAHCGAKSTIAVIGSEPQIYFYSRRHSATGYLYTYPLMERQPFALRMRDDMIQEVERARPDFLVRVNNENSWAPFPDSDQTIFKWTDAYSATNYSLVGYIGRLPSGNLVESWGPAQATAVPRQNCLLVYAKKPPARR